MTLQLNKERPLCSDVFKESWPDEAAELLGTGYCRFKTAYGIEGLAKEQEDGKRLDVLAVFSQRQRQGMFRLFMANLKAHYRTICVWSVWNEFLPAVLERYGFEVAFDFQAGQNIQGWRWDKEGA